MSAIELPVWTAAERESFFAAIDCHRRAAWQVSAVAGICVVILAFVVATLTAPLFYALIGLVLDLINLIIPMPDWSWTRSPMSATTWRPSRADGGCISR
jgi:hypothetical protein